MRLIDEPYTKTPVDGWPRLMAQVRRLGLPVHHQRGQRLRRTMGLQALSPKPRTRVAAKDHQISPSRLSAVVVSRPSQVWRADSTDGHLAKGVLSLVASLAWGRR